MPPQPVIPNWVRVIARLAHEGNTMMVGLDFKPNSAGPYTGGQISDLVTGISTAITTQFLALMTSSWSISAYEGTDRSVVGGAFAQYNPVPNTGTLGGDSTPANCAVVLSKRTGLSGRVNHGRMYIPGVSDALVVGSTVQPTYLLAINALATLLLAYAGPGTLPGKFAIASIKDLAMKTITSYALDAIVDSQRRRLPGRGY